MAAVNTLSLSIYVLRHRQGTGSDKNRAAKVQTPLSRPRIDLEKYLKIYRYSSFSQNLQRVCCLN